MALVKLKIEAFKDPQCSSSAGKSIVAMFNPESYTRKFQAEYSNADVAGDSNATKIFRKINGSDITLKLIADGTGVVPLPSGVGNVDDYIKKIQDIVFSYQGEEHHPYYLKVVWGSLSFISICDSLNINYTLFNDDGSALRATIELTLSENFDFKTKVKQAQKSSPDLTHFRTVKGGDTLPMMTYRIYGDSSYYMEVARANNLKSVYDIKPGDQIYFPPIKK